MIVRTALVLSALALTSAASLGFVRHGRTLPGAASIYTIDPIHSSVVFKIKHFNVAPFHGTFEKLTGTVNFDEANPSGSSIEAEIPVESVHTHADKRDAHLKSKDFFNAESFPTISFKSKSFTKTGENTFDVAGDLTMHGVTKPVTAKLEKTGAGKGMGGAQLIGFDVAMTVKRSDFDITFMPDALGDDVKVMIGIEAAKK